MGAGKKFDIRTELIKLVANATDCAMAADELMKTAIASERYELAGEYKICRIVNELYQEWITRILNNEQVLIEVIDPKKIIAHGR